MDDKKTRMTIWSYVNGKLVSYKEEEKVIKPVKISCDEIYNYMKNNLGIGMFNNFYLEVNDIQDKDYEYSKILKFIRKYLQVYADKNNLNANDLKVEFLNYGKTELVYVLTEPSGNRVTLLVKQPAVEFGRVKQEADNLIKLNDRDKNVIAPIDYYFYEDQELYVTPYMYQSRCIASDASWGMYIPEPCYRFESFTEEQSHIVNTCMIAKLVSLYDEELQEGISSCKLGGGDFMLTKGWEENRTPTIKDTLESIYLIAARDKISCSLDEYITLVLNEFTQRTIGLEQNKFLLNHRARVPMNRQDVEMGIEIGKEIIKNRKKDVDFNM